MTKILMILMSIVIVSCASVRQKDLDSWVGVDLIELETHQLFSTIPLQKTQLSDGTILYNYSNSTEKMLPTNCSTNAYGFTTCTGGGKATATCNNQFFVKDNVVLSYRAIGKCYTSCSVRPASRSCD